MALFSRLEAYFSMLKDDPLNFLIYLVFFTVTILLALILHEVSHGYVAFLCGDPTARMLGRLSLDPRKHLDPLGTITLILFGIGWAKPVPINPRYFSEPRKDDFLVSIAGITMNFTLFLLSISLSVALTRSVWTENALLFNNATTLMDFNGSWFFQGRAYREMYAHLFRCGWAAWLQRFLLLFAKINLSLAIFNFFPIPPLDGFHLLNDTLLGGKLHLSGRAFRITQAIVMILCVTGLLGTVHSYLYNLLNNAVVGLLLKATGLS